MAEFGNFSVLALQDRVDRLEKALDAPDVTEAREHAKELVQDLEKEIELDQQAAERNRDEFKKDQDWKARLWPKNYKKNATFISTQIAAPEEEVVQDQRLLETARSLREQLGASPSERLLAFMRKQGERDGADIVAAGKRFVAALVKNLSLEKVKAFEREARGTLLRNEVSSGVAAEVLAPAGRQICTLLREALGNIEQGDAGGADLSRIPSVRQATRSFIGRGGSEFGAQPGGKTAPGPDFSFHPGNEGSAPRGGVFGGLCPEGAGTRQSPGREGAEASGAECFKREVCDSTASRLC